MGYQTWRSNAPACRGKKLTVGAGKTQLAPPQDGVIIDSVSVLADQSNTAAIYIGGVDVSNTAGFKLNQGQGLPGIRVTSLDVIWAVADAEGQVLWIFYTEPVGENVS